MTGEELLRLLERRLDNVVYRLGFAGTRAQARQFVNHGHVLVDGRKVDIASFLVKPGEAITIKEPVRELASAATELTGAVAGWLQTDFDALEGKVLRLPERIGHQRAGQRAADRRALLAPVSCPRRTRSWRCRSRATSAATPRVADLALTRWRSGCGAATREAELEAVRALCAKFAQR